MEEKQGTQRDFPTLDAVYLEFKNLLRKVEPPAEIGDHFRRARIEVLKGMRQMIDNRIENLEHTQQKGEKINVD